MSTFDPSSATVCQCMVPVPLIGAEPTPVRLPSYFPRLRKSDFTGETVRFAQLSKRTSNALESKSTFGVHYVLFGMQNRR